jgi:hypothetical protein
MLNSGSDFDGKMTTVFIEIKTAELDYRWTRELEFVNGIDIRQQLFNAEVDLWTSLVRRLARLSKF